jgi:hypothetical protein
MTLKLLKHIKCGQVGISGAEINLACPVAFESDPSASHTRYEPRRSAARHTLSR